MSMSQNRILFAYGIEIPRDMKREREIFEKMYEDVGMEPYIEEPWDEDFPTVMGLKGDYWDRDSGEWQFVKLSEDGDDGWSHIEIDSTAATKKALEVFQDDPEWNAKFHEFLDKYDLSALKDIKPGIVSRYTCV